MKSTTAHTPQKIPSYETLEKRFIEGVIKTVDVDYGSPASVRRHNRGVDTYRKAAADIGTYHPHEIPRFAALLTHEHLELRICAAVCLAELMPSSPDVREAALNEIKRLRDESDGHERMGWDRWLERHG